MPWSAPGLKTLPLYVQAGAIVPLGPVRQYAAEPVNEPLTLQMYPGADGRFALYEDDGESFRYRRGEFTRILCHWKDSEKVLTLRVDPKGRVAHGRKINVRIAGNAAPKIVALSGPRTVVGL